MATLTSMTSAAASTLTGLATSVASTTSSSASSMNTHPSPATTAPIPSSTGNDNSGDGPTSRPLLFFVALGFGVVFTNLWIIVGVKYCFRYNQRARQGAFRDENGDPIDLNNMPRPRRRKEKKLMSMEEVNERFPLVKYKTWRATREQEGLPTEGGVNISASRAASIKEPENPDAESTDPARASSSASAAAAGALPAVRLSTDAQHDMSSQSQDFAESTPPRTSTDRHGIPEVGDQALSQEKPVTAANLTGFQHDDKQNPEASADQPAANLTSQADDDEDDPIRTAVPAELLAAPGDACAICIDTLEDDDEVRGLTCGHAFHAGCLDPWLTSRRACCPLCKADYYVPKPRPEGEAPAEGTNGRRDGRSVTMPQAAWIGGRTAPFRPQLLFSGAGTSRFTVEHHDRYGFPLLRRSARTQQFPEEQPTEQGEASVQPPQNPGLMARFSDRVRNIPLHPPLRLVNRTRPAHGGNTTSPEEPSSTTTPSQLEAGTTVR